MFGRLHAALREQELEGLGLLAPFWKKPADRFGSRNWLRRGERSGVQSSDVMLRGTVMQHHRAVHILGSYALTAVAAA